MKHRTIALILGLLIVGFGSCESPVKQHNELLLPKVDWSAHEWKGEHGDSLESGSTYLPVYSEIYQRTDAYTYPLTITVSIRNMSKSDTIFLQNAEYFNTHGDLIRDYVKSKVFVKPMETIEIVVREDDLHGGTGANFMFDWEKNPGTVDPLFEAVMISTTGQQGLSFTTRGVRK